MRPWRGESEATGWVTVTLNNPFTVYNAETVRYQRVGLVVYLVGAVQRNAASDGAIVFTLPAGYRPQNPGGWRFTNDSNSTSQVRIVVGTDGTVRVYEKSGTWTSCYLHTVFLTV